MKPIVRRLIKWSVILAAIAGIWLTEPWQRLPPQWNPWTPLDVSHPMTPVGKWKLSQLKDDPLLCRAVLETAPTESLDYLPLEDYTPVEGCPLTNVVRINRSQVSYNSPFTVTCPLAVSWLMFEHHKLQPLAREHLGSPVTRVDHFGSFACRNIYSREQGRRSQHATANAFDVAAFQLSSGTSVAILRDWDNVEAPEKSVFLKELHEAACQYFGTVLGPDYNQPHEDHFHLEGAESAIAARTSGSIGRQWRPPRPRASSSGWGSW